MLALSPVSFSLLLSLIIASAAFAGTVITAAAQLRDAPRRRTQVLLALSTGMIAVYGGTFAGLALIAQ